MSWPICSISMALPGALTSNADGCCHEAGASPDAEWPVTYGHLFMCFSLPQAHIKYPSAPPGYPRCRCSWWHCPFPHLFALYLTQKQATACLTDMLSQALLFTVLLVEIEFLHSQLWLKIRIILLFAFMVLNCAIFFSDCCAPSGGSGGGMQWCWEGSATFSGAKKKKKILFFFFDFIKILYRYNSVASRGVGSHLHCACPLPLPPSTHFVKGVFGWPTTG